MTHSVGSSECDSMVGRPSDTTIMISGGDTGGLILALAEAANKATSTVPYIIYLLPGVYTITDHITIPSNTKLVGAGQTATVLKASATGSVLVGGLFNPNVFASSTDGVSISHLKIDSTITGGAGLVADDATNFSLSNVIIEGNKAAFIKDDTALPTSYTEATICNLRDCSFIAHGSSNNVGDSLWISLVNVYMYNCYVLVDMSSGANPSDGLTIVGDSVVVAEGCVFVNRSRTTLTNGSMACANIHQPSSDGTQLIRFVGCYFLVDCTQGDLNFGSGIIACVNITTGSTAGDYTIYFEGCTLEYVTAAVTSAQSVGGIVISNPTTNGLDGTVYVNNCTIRDLGGSGGTTRKDIVVTAATVPGSRIAKSVKISGSRVSSADFRGTSPGITQANWFNSENTLNFQQSSAAFSSAATAAVTLPVSFSSSAFDYNVLLEPSVGESFWVTAKTNTGFTLNSSNAASTATLRYVVMR